MSYMFIDFETKSFCDLPKHGAYVYSEDETTDILTMAYAIDDGPVNIWIPGQPLDEFFEFTGQYVARNALFEYAIVSNVLSRYFSPLPDKILNFNNWIDTRGLSLCAGLPGSLDGCTKALGVSKKLESGKRLINLYSKPAKRKDGSKYFREFTPEDWAELIEYNIQDVEADRATFKMLFNLPNVKVESDVMTLDMKQNSEGLRIDVDTLNLLIGVLDEETKKAEKEAETIGVNPRSPKQLIEYLEGAGITVNDTTKDTIDGLLKRKDLSKDVKNLLYLRQFLSKASVKKLYALKDTTAQDNRMRHFIQYYGAHTGRYSGRGFQVHNLPKTGTDADGIDEFIKEIKAGDYTRENIIDKVKAILPGLIIPDDGYTFLMGDFAAIEARGIAWLAGQEDMLDDFRAGHDIYKVMAGSLFGILPNKVNKSQRALGKVVILACSYGMGKNTFKATCENWGIDISAALAERAVDTYRQKYRYIYKFWYDLQIAFKYAMIDKGAKKVGKYLTVQGSKNRVEIILPSGRRLYYHRPGMNGDQLTYYNYQRGGENYLWGGILAENVTQAMCRDILTSCMVRADEAGLNPVLHVHDEVVCQVKENEVDTASNTFNMIMNTAPTWAPGFPLSTEIEISRRYRK